MRARLVVAHNQVEGTQQQPEVPSLWQPAEGVPGANAPRLMMFGATRPCARRSSLRAARTLARASSAIGAASPGPMKRADFDEVVKHFGPLIRR